MRRFGWCGTAVAAVLVLLPAPAPAAESSVRVSVDRPALRSGQQLTATARAGQACAWSVSWGGQTRTGRGRTLVARFTAPSVERPTRIPVRARCFSDAAGVTPSPSASPTARAPQRPGGASQRITVGVPGAPTGTVVVTVLPPGVSVLPPITGSGLPSTGGPARWFVLAGLGAVLVGATTARIARRRVVQSPGRTSPDS